MLLSRDKRGIFFFFFICSVRFRSPLTTSFAREATECVSDIIQSDRSQCSEALPRRWTRDHDGWLGRRGAREQGLSAAGILPHGECNPLQCRSTVRGAERSHNLPQALLSSARQSPTRSSWALFLDGQTRAFKEKRKRRDSKFGKTTRSAFVYKHRARHSTVSTWP